MKSENLSVPFNQSSPIGNELAYIEEAIHADHISGDGKFTRKCSELLEAALGVPKCLLTTSCTDALEMAALLLDVGPGDEVIVPSFTFVSTVNAFVLRGATPKFIDIRPDTLNMDERQLARMISSKTKAIIPVHYAGVGCEMDQICEISSDSKVAIVEDNAHGLFGKYKGKYLGTFGTLATQSFHETKNFSSGEGGALLINDPKLVERAEILRDKGTNRKKFFRGQVDKYSWVDLGSSFLPSDMIAAYLLAQLERRDQVQKARKFLWEFYFAQLKAWAESSEVGLPVVPSGCDQAFHMFYIICPSLKWRREMIAHLKSANIHSVFHYLPLNTSEMGRKFGGHAGQCPVAEDLSDRILRLPFFNSMTLDQAERVVAQIRKFDPSSIG